MFENIKYISRDLMNEFKQNSNTFGFYAYKNYGIGGAREEAYKGMPLIKELTKTNIEGLELLIKIINNLDDTVMLKRAGNIEKYKFVTSIGQKDGLKPLPAETGESFAISDTGELYRDWEKKLGIIDTPMTKCAYGMLCKNGEIAMNGVKIKCDTDYAVIAMSSLTNSPITESDNILLTTVGRAENTDAKFSGDLMLNVGRPPVLVENIEAEVEIETTQEGMSVWAISAEGYYIGTVPTEQSGNKLIFKVGEISRSMYYLIVKS